MHLHQRLSSTARVLALTLLTLTLAVPAPAADQDRALELLGALGCKGCHRIGGSGGSFGPPLDGVGKRLDRGQIRRKLLDPKGANPAALMPSFGHLSAEDLDTLTGYLQGLR